MSMFVFYEGVSYSLDDYCMLTEALQPRETQYGIYPECKNGKIDLQNGCITTWFKDGDDIFLVQIDSKGEFGFARHVPGRSFEFEHPNYVMDQSLPMTNSLQIFGKVFYLALLLSNKSNTNLLKFSGSHPKLGSVYSRMLNNKSILQKLNDNGWSHKYEEIPNTRPILYQHVLTRK